MAVELEIRSLAPVIEFLAEPFRQLVIDVRGRDCRIIAFIQLEDEAQLAQVGINGRCHVRILKLHRQLVAVKVDSLVNLAKRRRRNGLTREGLQFLLPVRAKLGGHPAAGEEPAHCRCIGLKACQLFCIFGRQRVGNGGQDLRHLHDRPLETAKRLAKIGGMFRPVDLHAKIAFACHAGGKSRHCRGDTGVTSDPTANPS